MPFREAIICGAGALGSFLGARLSRLLPTTLVAREEHAAAISRDGLRIGGLVDETARGGNLSAVSRLEAVGAGALVLLTMKIHDATSAARELAPLLRDDALVLCLQNGLDVEKEVRRALNEGGAGAVRVLRGMAMTGVTHVAPGRIEYWGGGLAFPAEDAEAEELAALFRAAGLETRISGEFARELWWKMAVNCIGNPLTALTGVRNDGIITPELRGVREAVAEACRRVAAAEGVELPAALADEIDAAMLKSHNRSSMLQDVERGRRTEIEELNGRVARMAAGHGIPAPANALLAARIRALEKRHASGKDGGKE